MSDAPVLLTEIASERWVDMVQCKEMLDMGMTPIQMQDLRDLHQTTQTLVTLKLVSYSSVKSPIYYLNTVVNGVNCNPREAAPQGSFFQVLISMLTHS